MAESQEQEKKGEGRERGEKGQERKADGQRRGREDGSLLSGALVGEQTSLCGHTHTHMCKHTCSHEPTRLHRPETRPRGASCRAVAGLGARLRACVWGSPRRHPGEVGWQG